MKVCGATFSSVLVILAFTLWFGLSGCSTVGNKQILNQNLISQIKPGESSKADVQRLIGEPTKQNYLDSGDTVWEYDLTQSQIRGASFIPVVGLFAGGANIQVHTLTIRFDKRGIVKDLGSGQATGGGGSILD